MTPKSAWEDIDDYIPKDKVIWEAFYGDGQSAQHLQELGCKEVIHSPADFFQTNEGEVIVSNPPFSDCKRIMPRLKELGKPFILIMPSSKINTSYFRDSFGSSDDPVQIIIPKKRIQFIKLVDGVEVQQKNSCNFDCFYYCWKMNLPRDIVWLE
jgi:hypothetical protein